MFSRKVSGFMGILGTLFFFSCILFLLNWLKLPSSIFLGAAFFLGILFFFQLISFWRGIKSNEQRFCSFQSNALGDPKSEIFIKAYDADAPIATDEKILCHVGPLRRVASGVRGFFSDASMTKMGRTLVKDAENACLLTNRRLLFVMIGPKEIRQFGGIAKTTAFLEKLPADALAKRNWLWLNGAQEVRKSLDALIEKKTLECIRNELFSYSIPLRDIRGFKSIARTQSLLLTMSKKNLQYSFRNKEDLISIYEQLKKLGLVVLGN